MSFHGQGLLPFVLLMGVSGCAAPSAVESPLAVVPASPARTLVMAINNEVGNLSPQAQGPTSPGRTTRVFNADLTLFDAQDRVHPYLAETIPQLNTDAWRVFPDGRMETTWMLKPGLTWQDGQPLTADDVAFAFQVYTALGLKGLFGPKPQDQMNRVEALDHRTVLVHWRSSFLHQGEGLTPLPSHLLAASFAALEQNPAGQRDAFMAQPFWTKEFVGAGPYRIINWEPASYLEGQAFDAHVLGRPKIDRVVIRIITNDNTVLANLLAGEIDLAMVQAVRFEQAMVLRDQGGYNDAENRGKIIYVPASTNIVTFQLRPEYQQSPGLLDVRVRQALASAIDRAAINERVFAGQAPVPNSLVLPKAPYYGDVDAAIAKYPYDPAASTRLLNEAGYSRDHDGILTAGGQRFQPALLHQPDTQNLTTATIVVSMWQAGGVDVQPTTVTVTALQQDLQTRAVFPGTQIYSIMGTEIASLNLHTSAQIPSATSGWNGNNRGGWTNPDFERLVERYNTTLLASERIDVLIQAMKLYTAQLPSYPLYTNLQVMGHIAALKGPEANTTHWNIHEWEWR